MKTSFLVLVRNIRFILVKGKLRKIRRRKKEKRRVGNEIRSPSFLVTCA